MTHPSFVTSTVSLALACLVALTPAIGLAQQAPQPTESVEDANVLRERGNEAMSALQPANAVAAYRKAYALSKEPALLYNIGHALEMTGDLPGALEAYQSFRQLAPAELRLRVPRLDQLIADLRARVTLVTIRCNVPGARILVRDSVAGESPKEGAVEQTFVAGPANIEVTAEGYAPYRTKAQFAPGGAQTFEIQLVPTATAGILAIRTSPVDAMILVDGLVVGQAPVEDTVPAGIHRILARHAGYPDTGTQVVAEVGSTKEVTIRLEKTPPVFTRWWFWTSVGVVVVGGVVLTYALDKARSPDVGTIPPGQSSAPLMRF